MTLASLHGKDPVTCSRGVIIVPDASLDDIDDEALYDVILVPGGLKGVENLSQVCYIYWVWLFIEVGWT